MFDQGANTSNRVRVLRRGVSSGGRCRGTEYLPRGAGVCQCVSRHVVCCQANVCDTKEQIDCSVVVRATGNVHWDDIVSARKTDRINMQLITRPILISMALAIIAKFAFVAM